MYLVNFNEDGDFTGELNISGWEANLTGNYKQIGPSYYEMTAQLIGPDFSVSMNKRAEIGKRYFLAAESTSSLLPFVFECKFHSKYRLVNCSLI